MIKFIALMVMITPFVANAEDNFLARYLVGNYLLIGQGVDSKSTYSGNVSMYLENNKLKVKRTIKGKVTIGQASFKQVLQGDSSVLRIQFSENGISFEETCLLRGDLDNYARITCYLYIPGADITNPGLEALFIDNSLN